MGKNLSPVGLSHESVFQNLPRRWSPPQEVESSPAWTMSMRASPCPFTQLLMCSSERRPHQKSAPVKLCSAHAIEKNALYALS